MKELRRRSPPQLGHSTGNSSPTRASSFAQVIRDGSWERGFSDSRRRRHLDLGGSTGGYDDAFPRGDERLERLDVIENTLEVQPAVAPEKGLCRPPHLLPNSAAGCSSFSRWSARQGGASRRRNAAACRLLPRSGSPIARPCRCRVGAIAANVSATRPQTQADACAMALKPRGSRQSPAWRKPILLPVNSAEDPHSLERHR